MITVNHFSYGEQKKIQIDGSRSDSLEKILKLNGYSAGWSWYSDEDEAVNIHVCGRANELTQDLYMIIVEHTYLEIFIADTLTDLGEILLRLRAVFGKLKSYDRAPEWAV